MANLTQTNNPASDDFPIEFSPAQLAAEAVTSPRELTNEEDREKEAFLKRIADMDAKAAAERPEFSGWDDYFDHQAQFGGNTYEQDEAVRASLAGPIESGVSTFTQTALKTAIADPLKFAGLVSKYITDEGFNRLIYGEEAYRKGETQTPLVGANNPLYSLGHGFEQMTKAVLPYTNPKYDDKFGMKVVQGFGSAAGFMAGGGLLAAGSKAATKAGVVTAGKKKIAQVTKEYSSKPGAGAAIQREYDKIGALKVKELTAEFAEGGIREQKALAAMYQWRGIAPMGAAVNGVGGWEDARYHVYRKAAAEGREPTEEELQKLWIALGVNAVGGLSEALGAGALGSRFLASMDRITKGAFGDVTGKAIIKHIGGGALKESAQEGGQTALLNITASYLAKYDEDRSVTKGVLESMLVGGIIGGLFGGGMVLTTKALNSKATRLEELRFAAKEARASGAKETAAVLEEKADKLEEEIFIQATGVLSQDAFPSGGAAQSAVEDEANGAPMRRFVEEGEAPAGEVVDILDEEGNFAIVDRADEELPTMSARTKPKVIKRDGVTIDVTDASLADGQSSAVMAPVIKAVKEVEKRLGLKPGTLSIKTNRGGGGIFVRPEDKGSGVIEVDLDFLTKDNNAVARRPDYIARAVDEEGRHVARDRAMFADFLAAGGDPSDTAAWTSFRKEKLEGVWSEMTEKDRTKIRTIRGERGKQESEAQLAEEFIRYSWQRIATGKTTEGWKPENNSYLTKALNSIIRFFKKATGKGINPRIAKEIKAVEAFLKAQQGKGAEVAEVAETEVAETEVAKTEVKAAEEVKPAKKEEAAKPAEEAALDEDAMAEAADVAAEAAEVAEAAEEAKPTKPTTETAGAEAAKERAAEATAKAEETAAATKAAAEKARAEGIENAAATSEALVQEQIEGRDADAVGEQIIAAAGRAVNKLPANQRDAADGYVTDALVAQAAAGQFDIMSDKALANALSRRAGLLVIDFTRSKQGIGKTGARKNLMDATSTDKELGEEGGTMGDVLPDTGAITPAEVLSLEQRAERMAEVLDEMDADQAAVLRNTMEGLTNVASYKNLGITEKKHRNLLKKAKAEFTKRMTEKSGIPDPNQWAFDPLDESAMSEYSNDNAFKRDQFTKAQSGILPPRNSSPIKTTLGGERLPAHGADFSDNVRRRAAAISQGIFRASEEIGLGLGLTPDEASVFTLDALLHPTEDVAVDKAAPLIKNLRRELRLLSLSKLKGEYKYHARGSEAEVYHDIDNMAVYKIVSLLPDGGIGKAAPVGHFRADQSGYLEGYSLHKNQSFLQFSERLRAENNHGGFVFTEIVGVVESGIVTKQRYVNAVDISPADLAKHLRTRNLELMPPTAVEVMLGDDVKRAVSVIGNRSFVHGDLHHQNVLKGKDGEVYIVDALTRELAPVEKAIPVIKRDLDRARGDVSEGTKTFAYDPLAGFDAASRALIDARGKVGGFDEGLKKQTNIRSALEYIIANGTEGEARLAKALLRGTTPSDAVRISYSDTLDEEAGYENTHGLFVEGRDGKPDRISISNHTGYKVGITLHEVTHVKAVHALNSITKQSSARLGNEYSNDTERWLTAITRAMRDGEPVSDEEVAAAELHMIFNRLKKSDQFRQYYGSTNVHEMIAEAFSKPRFVAFLKRQKFSGLGELMDGEVELGVFDESYERNLWEQFKASIVKLLGLNADEATVFDRVMESSMKVMEAEANVDLDRARGDVGDGTRQYAFDPMAGNLDVGHTGNAGFFSKMIAVTERLPQDVWTPDQLLAKLKKSPGITQDEIDIIGLEEELNTQAYDTEYRKVVSDHENLKPGQVHKDDVAAFIRMNQVTVDEVVAEEGDTKWESYSGGDLVLKGYEPGTYREMRLTVPLNPTMMGTDPVKYQSAHWRDMNVVVHVRFNDRVDENGNKVLFIEELQSDWAKDYRNALGEGMGFTAEELAKWKADLKHYKALRDRTQKYRLKRDEKTLEGLVKRSGEQKIPFTEAEFEKALADSKSDAVARSKQLGDKLYHNYNNMVMRLEQKIAAAKNPSRLVPEPTMKARHNDLAVKRMLRWAIGNGYSKVSWMNGTETAKRYSKLDIPVKSLQINRAQKKVVDGVRQWTYDVRYYAESSSILSDGEVRLPGYHSDVTKSKLAKLIGKKGAEEAAKKADDLAEGMHDTVGEARARARAGDYGAVHYTLEKEVSQMAWAYALYDQIIPQKFKKYAKKAGGSGALTDTVLSQQEGFELVVFDPDEGSHSPSVHKTKKGAEDTVMEEATGWAEYMYEFPEWVEVKEEEFGDARSNTTDIASIVYAKIYLVDKRSGKRLTNTVSGDALGYALPVMQGDLALHGLPLKILNKFKRSIALDSAVDVVVKKSKGHSPHGYVPIGKQHEAIGINWSEDGDQDTAYNEIFKPIHDLVKETVRNTTITENTSSIVFQSIDIEQGMVDKNHELNATYAYDPMEGSLMSEEEAAKHATKEQIDAVITAGDNGEPVSVSFGGLGAKALRLIKGDWLSVVDTLEDIGLSKLAKRVYQYEIKKGEYQGKLFAGMRGWEKPLTSTQIKEAHEEAGKYFEIREDYGSTQAVHTLLTQMRKIKQRNEGAEQPDLTEYKRLERALSVIIKREAREARARAADYLTNMTNGNAINLIRVVEDTAEMTGGLSDQLGIQVQEGKGKWRPLKNMGRLHYPRRLSQRVLDVINEPSRDWALYQSLKDALVRDGLESDAAAEEYLADMISGGEMQGGEFMANVERARGLRMPKEFYDTSVDGYLQFLLQFSNRAAQVWAFGQTTNKSADAFGAAIKAARGDEAVRKYLQEVAKTVYRRRETPTKSSRFFERFVSITGIAYLSGYFTAVRDFVSGVMLANEQFGFRATLPEGGRALVQAARAVGRTLRNAYQRNWKVDSSELVEEAMGMGAITEDFQQAQIMEERLTEGTGDKAIRATGNKALYFKQSMDRLARGVTMGASLNWLRASRAIYANRKGEYLATQRVAALKRLKFTEEEAQLLLSGDQSLVEEFARRSVAEKQYTYSIAQHPLFLGNQGGVTKLMLQFQRWTFQRGRDIIKNVTSPLVFGTTVGGKNYRTAMPAIRFLAGGILFGELLQWLSGLFTDKERRDPSLEEIEMAEDEKVWKILDRIAKDMVFTGATGFWGDYAMLAKEQATRGGRWKDPFKPPMFNLANDLIGAGRGWIQKGRSAEAAQQEFVEMARNIPLVKQTEGLGRGWYRAGEELATGKPAEGLWAAKRDLSYTRTLARRFGEETGISVESKFNGIFADDKYTTYKVNLKDALLAGDLEAAREAKDTLVEMGMSLRSLKSVVRSNQPIRVGMQTKADTQNAFLRWARKNVPSGVARINRVQDRYRGTAGRLGL